MDKKPKDFLKKTPAPQPVSNAGKFMDDISKCLEVLKTGGLVLLPTDTYWSIACDATNENAVKKIYELKQRDLSQTLTVLVEHADRLGRHVKQIPDVAIQLIEVNDKPMTIVYPGVVNLAPSLLESDGSAAIRITNDEFCKKLVSSFQRPIVATSANTEDDDAPEIFKEITDEIKSAVNHIVKWRQNDPTPGEPSSKIKVGVRGEVQIIRQ